MHEPCEVCSAHRGPQIRRPADNQPEENDAIVLTTAWEHHTRVGYEYGIRLGLQVNDVFSY